MGLLGTTIKSLNVAQRIFIVLALLFCIAISYSSTTTYRDLKRGLTSQDSRFNLLNSKRKMSILSISAQINSLQSELNFMVWPIERKKLLEQLNVALRQQINFNPYHGETWLALHGIDIQLAKPRAEQIWSLQQALKFNAWNRKYVYRQTYYCLYQNEFLFVAARRLCNSVFVQIPWQKNNDWLAKKIGVDRTVMENLRAKIDAAI